MIETQRANALDGSKLTDDYKLLQLPTQLTADELNALCCKNKDDYIFCRACREYAEKYKIEGFNGIIDTMAIRVKALAELQEILPQYTKSDVVSDVEAFDNSKLHFDTMAEKGTLATLDDVIAETL